MGIFKFSHPFFLFALSLLLFISGIIVLIFSVFIVIRLWNKIFDNINYRKLKHIIGKNPRIGQQDEDGNLVYSMSGFTIKYRICSRINEGHGKIEFVSVKKKLRPCEYGLSRFEKSIKDFFVYNEWICLFNLPALPLLLISISIFYFVLFEPQMYKYVRLRWIIASVLMTDIKNVEIGPEGWFKILGSRRTVVDKQNEPISYNFNPFKWLTFQDDGYITRWRGEPYGYVDHAVRYDNHEDIWLEKEGQWIGGEIYKDRVNWQEAQGTGIRAGKVLGHNLRLRGGLSTDDK